MPLKADFILRLSIQNVIVMTHFHYQNRSHFLLEIDTLKIFQISEAKHTDLNKVIIHSVVITVALGPSQKKSSLSEKL